MKLSRRHVTRFLVGAPVAAAAALAPLRALWGAPAAQPAEPRDTPAPQATPSEPEETPLARFLARQETDLSADEKRRVRKQVAQLEQALAEVRAHIIGNDVPPSGSWKALRSNRSGGTR